MRYTFLYLLCPHQLLASRVPAETGYGMLPYPRTSASLSSATQSLRSAFIPLGEEPEQSLAHLMPTPKTGFQWCTGSGRAAGARWKSLTPYVHRKSATEDTTTGPDRAWSLTTHLPSQHLRVTVKSSSIPGCSWPTNSCDPGPRWLLGTPNQVTRDRQMVLCTGLRCLPLSLKQSRISLLLQKPKLSFT